MERTMSVEDKIRRAEEIYVKRQGNTVKRDAIVSLNDNKKRNLKLLKKMGIQILASLLIYFSIYMVQNNNYIFSEDFLNKANEILSYDTNFKEIFENIKQNVNDFRNNNLGIGGASNDLEDNDSEGDQNEGNTTDLENTESQNEGVDEGEETNKNISQEEQDIKNIKATTTFIKPVEGVISSKYGIREPTTASVPKNHTGVDIAANTGTKIISSTSGEVVLDSEEGDYGKHLKIQIGEVSIIYAHCSTLYVKQGDKVEQGQEIAEVGSTGNSTGPHLHFEIRISERTVDPEKILEL